MPKILNLILILISLTIPMPAQVDRASLSGTVTDPSGAIITHATIDVVFESTGFKRTVQSNDVGTYAVTALPIGRCQVTAQANGFQSQQVADLGLTVGETRTLDFHLGVSASTETIQVTAAAVGLEMATAETGGLIDSQQVKAMPINGRNWAGLMVLIPGAINTGIGNQTGIRFAGHGLDDNKLVFDGADATGILRQSQKTDLRLQISSEAIAEFRVNSSLYSAEFGGAGGGQADVVSKSGNNGFHGSVFEFFGLAPSFDTNG